ncbi:MAG: hypothetical protein GKR88_09065 [Flavobacteriaceae bacterium]|nr:MAG: hypothetical protein GKR88_09065 [Flavobacteriaceae bacterium]
MNKISLPISIIAVLLSVVSFFYNNSSSGQVYVDVNKLIEGYNRHY